MRGQREDPRHSNSGREYHQSRSRSPIRKQARYNDDFGRNRSRSNSPKRSYHDRNNRERSKSPQYNRNRNDRYVGNDRSYRDDHRYASQSDNRNQQPDQHKSYNDRDGDRNRKPVVSQITNYNSSNNQGPTHTVNSSNIVKSLFTTNTSTTNNKANNHNTNTTTINSTTLTSSTRHGVNTSTAVSNGVSQALKTSLAATTTSDTSQPKKIQQQQEHVKEVVEEEDEELDLNGLEEDLEEYLEDPLEYQRKKEEAEAKRLAEARKKRLEEIKAKYPELPQPQQQQVPQPSSLVVPDTVAVVVAGSRQQQKEEQVRPDEGDQAANTTGMKNEEQEQLRKKTKSSSVEDLAAMSNLVASAAAAVNGDDEEVGEGSDGMVMTITKEEAAASEVNDRQSTDDKEAATDFLQQQAAQQQQQQQKAATDGHGDNGRAGGGVEGGGGGMLLMDIFSDTPPAATGQQQLHQQLHMLRPQEILALQQEHHGTGIGGGIGIGKTGAEHDHHLQSNYDDIDGYYKASIGELLGDRFQTLGILGKGVFSTVLKCKDLRSLDEVTQQPAIVAVKLIRNNETMRRAALTMEKEILLLLHHNKRYCVRLLTHFEYRSHIAFVFEYQAMNLREVLKKFGKNIGITIHAVRVYARQLYCALYHLATLKIFHADIKLDNILCSEDLKTVKLCDFGSACFETGAIIPNSSSSNSNNDNNNNSNSSDKKDNNVDNNTNNNTNNNLSTTNTAPTANNNNNHNNNNTTTAVNEITPYLVSRFYRAPEIILGLPYNRSLDLWSVTVCLYELFTGHVLFPGRSNNEMLYLIQEMKGKVPVKMIKQHLRNYNDILHLPPFFNEHNTQNMVYPFRYYDPSLSSTNNQTAAAAVKLMDLPIQPTKSLLQQLLSSKAQSDEVKLVYALGDLLEKGLEIDYLHKRMKISDVFKHPFIVAASSNSGSSGHGAAAGGGSGGGGTGGSGNSSHQHQSSNNHSSNRSNHNNNKAM